MQRQPFVAMQRSTTRTARTTRLGAGWMVRVSPEALAAGAVFSLSAVQIMGPLGVVLFIGMTGATMAVRPLDNLRELARFWPLLLLPLLAIASTMWSDAPQRTMRAGLQLLLTVTASIVVCRTLRIDRFIITLAGAAAVAGLTVAPGILGSIAAHAALSVWWGSKNQVGLVGVSLATLSAAIACDRQRSAWLRLAAIVGIGYGLVLAVAAQSGGALSALAIFLITFPPLAVIAALRLPLRLTIGALAAVAALAALFFVNALTAAIADFRVNVLGKDATLTGRTYLWEFAERLAASHPTLGTGYYAFWRQGNIDAEGLWRWGGIADRAGFNFHNAFVEMRVDLGLVGVGLLLGMCAVVLVAGLVRQFAKPSVPLACLIALTVVSYFRSYVEDGLVAPFSAVMLTWLATILYAVPATQPVAPETGARGRPISGRQPARAGRVPKWGGRRRNRGMIDAGG